MIQTVVKRGYRLAVDLGIRRWEDADDVAADPTH